jgi:hypothetical protein
LSGNSSSWSLSTLTNYFWPDIKFKKKCIPLKNHSIGLDQWLFFTFFYIVATLSAKLPLKLLSRVTLRYFTWISRGFFKILQISLFDVSTNIIGDVFFVFILKNFVSIWRSDFFVPNRGFTLKNPNLPIFYVFVARFSRS